jgi:hypothetical protein
LKNTINQLKWGKSKFRKVRALLDIKEAKKIEIEQKKESQTSNLKSKDKCISLIGEEEFEKV